MVPAFLAAALVTLLMTQDWSRADRETTRLPPSAFPNLPTAVRADLERRGCAIPQPYGATAPENVIAGAFTRKGDIDWAVLCSIRRVSTILIYREGSVQNVDRLAPSPDSEFLQVVTYDVGRKPVAGYSRAIGAADAKHIVEHYADFGGPKPPLVDHDGLEDSFVDKGSSIFYWYQGRWLKLTGMD